VQSEGPEPPAPRWWILFAVTLSVGAGVLGAVQLKRGEFASGGLLLLLSVAALRWPWSMWNGQPVDGPTGRRLALGLLMVCAVGVFFRTYRIEMPGLWGDDGINGLLAFDVLEGKIRSPFQIVRHSYSYFHAFTNYAIAGAFRIFGPGPVTLRLPGIVAGVLAVPLVYGTAAPLFGPRVALVAALFFASSPMQVNHSKILTQVVFGLFFQLLGMCLLVRGAHGGSRWLMWLGGAALALCLYTYHSARLAPLLPVVLILALALIRIYDRWRGSVTEPRPTGTPRLRATDIAATAAVSIACATPVILALLKNPALLFKRTEEVALWPMVRNSGSLWPLWDSIWRTLMIFPYQQGPVKYHWFGVGTEPALNVIVVFLVAHGLVESLRKLREPRHLLLLAWAFLGLLPGMLSTEAPRVYRVLQATPPLYMWAGLAVVRIGDWAGNRGLNRIFPRTIVVAVIAAVLVLDFNQYFYRTYTSSLFRDFQGEPIIAAAKELHRLGPGWEGRLIAPRFAARYESFAFLKRAWKLEISDVTSLTEVLPIRQNVTGGVLFAVFRGATGALDALHAFYPSIQPRDHEEPDPRSWWFDSWFALSQLETKPPPPVSFFAVPRETIEGARGLTATFSGADGMSVATLTVPALSLHAWPEAAEGQQPPTRAQWSGSVYVPSHGEYQIELLTNGSGVVRIDGVPGVSSVHRQGSLTMAQGLHALSAEAGLPEEPEFELRWAPRGQSMQIIPASFFFRDPTVHGLLAEYVRGERTLQRIEPFPYYQFFPATFSGPFSVRWRGRIDVPEPGGYRLDVAAQGAADIRVDEHPWRASERLGAGTHEIEMVLKDISGAARLMLNWTRPNGQRQLVPPQAFSPPGVKRDERESPKRSAE
jgi:hypothetical protein